MSKKKTFIVVIKIENMQVVKVVEGFNENKFTYSTMHKLEAKLYAKEQELRAKYPAESYNVLCVRALDFQNLKDDALKSYGANWGFITPQILDVVVTHKLIRNIYKQVPVDERVGLEDQARNILGIRSEKGIQTYVVEIWLTRRRLDENHDSEK